MADLVEASEEFLLGQDLLTTLQQFCPNRFLHNTELPKRLARFLHLTRLTGGASCSHEVEQFLWGELRVDIQQHAGMANLSSHFRESSSGSSVRIDLNMTEKTNTLLIHGAARAICESIAELTPDDLKEEVGLLEYELEDALRRATRDALGEVFTYHEEMDYYMDGMLLCADPVIARAAVCASVDNDIEFWIEDGGMVAANPSFNDTTRILAEAVEKFDRAVRDREVGAECRVPDGAVPPTPLAVGMTLGLRGDAKAHFAVNFTQEFMQQALGESMGMLCASLVPSSAEITPLYKMIMYSEVKQHKKRELRRALKCSRVRTSTMKDVLLSEKIKSELRGIFRRSDVLPARGSTSFASFRWLFSELWYAIAFGICFCLCLALCPAVATSRLRQLFSPLAPRQSEQQQRDFGTGGVLVE